jgi:predicted kinase
MLVGLPCTGKSTFRQRLKQDFEFLTISSDDYIESWGRAKGKTYSEVFPDYVKDATHRIEEDARVAKIKELDVVWDQTNLTVSKRKKILDKFDNYVKICVHFEIDVHLEWMRRLYRRAGEEGKYIPFHVLESMDRSSEYPQYSEGFDWIVDDEDFRADFVKELIK